MTRVSCECPCGTGTLRPLTRVSGAPLLCMDSVNQIKDLDRISPEDCGGLREHQTRVSRRSPTDSYYY
jgi:hypothetical protein